MLEHAVSALSELFQPLRMLALFGGMLAGLVFGMLPGLGGVAAVSILLPFIFVLDDFAGLAMLLGAVSVIYTSDTITSVLLGAPGSPASAPTAIEGHALAKQGQAARALGTGFLASMVGGLTGAVVLLVAIPVAGPIVLMLGTPELFMFAVVGLFFASAMVGRDLAKGLAAACLGIFLGIIGPASAAADFRYTFGQPFLLDGIALPIMALGLFGVAEVISMLAAGGGIAGNRMVIGRLSESVRDFLDNKFLILRSALIGVFGGFVPAVGASASTWVAYGHAMRSSKDRSRFGKGEIRGVASSEGANNATVISDLVPTILFSVPGGPAAAIFLGALFAFGYYPGPRMVTQNPDLMFLIVWSVALASVVGAAICFVMAPTIARLTRVPFGLIAAPLLLIMVVGALQATGTIGDLFLLFGLGLLGWMMKHAEWPRAPALVGFVLSAPMEQYFWLSSQLHGWSWVWRPGVLIIASIIVLPFLVTTLRKLYAARASAPVAQGGPSRQDQSPSAATTPTADPTPAPETTVQPHQRVIALVLAALMTGVFAFAFWEMFGFAVTSRYMPALGVVPGLALSAWLLLRAVRESGGASLAGFGEYNFMLTILAYPVAVWAIGFTVPTVALIAWMLLACARARLLTGLLYGAAIYALIMGMFHIMRTDVPTGWLAPLS